MRPIPWPTPSWPTNVPHTISGYERKVFSILDDSARNYPDMTYTIFNDGIRTFAQVKDTADRKWGRRCSPAGGGRKKI